VSASSGLGKSKQRRRDREAIFPVRDSHQPREQSYYTPRGANKKAGLEKFLQLIARPVGGFGDLQSNDAGGAGIYRPLLVPAFRRRCLPLRFDSTGRDAS
jgi:hypothetical protein